MELKILRQRKEFDQDTQFIKAFQMLEELLLVLATRTIPKELIQKINNKIEEINAYQGNLKQIRILIRKAVNGIVKLLERKLKLVPKHHYRNVWMGIGMVIFGLPIGILLGIGLNDFGLISVGLPIGLGIGIGIGMILDKKVHAEGRQLPFQIEY